MIFEFFPPEMTNIQLSCQATSAYIHKQVQRDFFNYSKMLVQINNNSKNTPDYIYLTMHGSAVAKPVRGYLIVYGIKDWSDNVTPEIYDHQIFEEMFEYDDGDMKMNTDIDMNNNEITNLNNGTDATDAVNKGQLDTADNKINTLKGKFDSYSFYSNSYSYRKLFGENCYDLKEVSKFRMVKKVIITLLVVLILVCLFHLHNLKLKMFLWPIMIILKVLNLIIQSQELKI